MILIVIVTSLILLFSIVFGQQLTYNIMNMVAYMIGLTLHHCDAYNTMNTLRWYIIGLCTTNMLQYIDVSRSCELHFMGINS